MKKILSLMLLLMTCMSTWAVDWSGIDWVTNGTSGDYANKYKFYTEVENLKVVNIQKPGFATADGFYITFPDAAFTAVKDGDTALTYDQQGAGICLHVDNFTKAETQVDVYNGDELRWTFYIYYPSAFVAATTEFGIVGDCNSWSATENALTFYTTLDSKVIKATADSFTTGQWGFKVRKGTGWSNLYGCSNAISTGKAETLDGDYNIHLGQAENNVTLTNVTFTVTLDDEGTPATLQVDADQTVSTADFHDKYILVGTQTGWSFETGYINLEYQSEGVYKASVDRFQGDFKIVKNGSWGTIYTTSTTIGLGDNTLDYHTDYPSTNASFASGMVLKNGTFTLTINDDNTATFNVAGSLSEEHSYGLVGVFNSWTATDETTLFTEQADGTYTYDNTAFPGGSQFKVSIDKSWTCFLAQSGVTSIANGVAYACARANNDNNLTIGESGKTYNAHFVLDPENAKLTVTYFSADDYTTLTSGDNTVKVLPVHNVATGQYVLTITSETAITGLGGSYWATSNGNEQLSTKGASADEYTYVVTTTSTTDPQLYTPLYVMMPGEVNFGTPTFDWIEIGGYSRAVTVDNYGTICLPCAATVTGATLYSIAGKTANSVVLEEVADNKAEAGVPYIFQATDASLSAVYTDATVKTVQAATGLVGNLSATALDVPTDSYIVYNNQLRKVAGATVTVGQNRAYVDLATVPVYTGLYAAKAIVLDVEGEATGISTINNEENSNPVYNLAGQRVNSNAKGIVIVNGKKYMR